MTCEAPWTDEQVQGLAEYQKGRIFHPYTCGGGGGPCSGVVMDATPNGLVCPNCGRRQTSIHADPAPFLETGQRLEEAYRCLLSGI